MKKFITKQEREADLIKRGKNIVESFQREFNKIKRIDESLLTEEQPKTARYGPDPTPEQSAHIAKFVKDSGDRKQAERLKNQSERLSKHIKGEVDESWGEDYGDGGYDPNDSPEHQGQEDFYDQMNQNETVDYNETGSIEIKPTKELRGGAQMYFVYYNGNEIYEFGQNSFRGMSLKDLAKRMFDTYNQSKYRMSLDTAIAIARKVFETLGRGKESGEEIFNK